ncbi:MAG: short subunit dehydrogenase-like uncharacterized protein [Marivirga sp.]|jgi:short subunit dehydrogenase-like uncharacterized protein
MKERILIYGANGYTGKLIVQEAKKQNINVHLAGRNKVAIETIAKETGFAHSVVDLSNTKALEQLLLPYQTVIHCAGPFTETAKQMVEACIRSQTNYLDITGEIWAFEEVMTYNKKAKAAGIKLIPGVGFDVVPTDCIAAQLKAQMPDATAIEMCFTGDKTSMSRGTAVTMAKNIAKGRYIRENGMLKNVPLAYKTKLVQFPHREQMVMTIPWGDLMTTYFQTKIPNIEIYTGVSSSVIKTIIRFRTLKFLLGIKWIQKMVRTKIENSVTGPSEQNLTNGKTYIIATVKNTVGDEITARLTTPEAYALTAKTAIKAATLLYDDSVAIENGYLTPAQAFGNEYIQSFDGVTVSFEHKKTPVNQTGVNYQP